MNYFYTATLLLTLAVCLSLSARAQVRKASWPVDSGVLNVPPPIVPDEAPRTGELEKVFGSIFQQPPEFPGGLKAMHKFMEANLHMPSKARRAGISGRVFLTFTVEETGEITNVTVLKGLGYGCDKEAVRMVQAMPRWMPGKLSGKIVKVKYNLPVSFTAK